MIWMVDVMCLVIAQQFLPVAPVGLIVLVNCHSHCCAGACCEHWILHVEIIAQIAPR